MREMLSGGEELTLREFLAKLVDENSGVYLFLALYLCLGGKRSGQ